MKLALIPPIPNLHQLGCMTNFHMVLAHLFGDQTQVRVRDEPMSAGEFYQRYYTRRALDGDYVILDNGAHEGPAVSLANLLVKGAKIHASEIVIPDAPHDTVNTVALFDQTLKLMKDIEWLGMWESAGRPKFMMVPQVPLEDPEAFEKFLDLARYMISEAVMYPGPLRFTIAIPLMYDALHGGIYSLVDRISWFTEETDIEIHLLGWSRQFTTPIDVAHDYPGVRSCDTAKPFVFARAGINLTTQRTMSEDPRYPGRPEDYFVTPLTAEELHLACRNAEFCRQVLETGNLPDMPEQGYAVSTTVRDDRPGDRSGLPDSAGSEEG